MIFTDLSNRFLYSDDKGDKSSSIFRIRHTSHPSMTQKTEDAKCPYTYSLGNAPMTGCSQDVWLILQCVLIEQVTAGLTNYILSSNEPRILTCSLSILSVALRYRVFLQHVSIACYAERCISYDRFRLSVCLSVCLSVRHSQVSCQNNSSCDHVVFTGGQPHDLVSSWLTWPRNSKGNIGSGGTKWERGRKKYPKIRNFQQISRHISETVQERTIVTMKD